MLKAARAIVIKDNSILVMKREKFGSTYYTLIGGHVEMGESVEKALLREIHEETMVRVSNPVLTFIESTEAPYGTQYVYVCEYVSGVPMLHPDSDESEINKGGVNMYIPMWVKINKLPSLPFRSEKLKEEILNGIKSGFPKIPLQFSSVK